MTPRAATIRSIHPPRGGIDGKMRLSLIQMNSRAAARDENVGRACQFVSRAAAEGAHLIVLPEFFNCEYFPQFRDYHYMDYAEPDTGPTTERIRATAQQL